MDPLRTCRRRQTLDQSCRPRHLGAQQQSFPSQRPPADMRAARMPNGSAMSVHTVCLGRHWYPYRYSRTVDDDDGSQVKAFPDWLADLGRRAVADAYRDPRAGARYNFGGPSRFAFHGVPKTLPGTGDSDIDLRSGRLNITLRESGLE